MHYGKEFPQEHFVELKGLSPFLVGRISVYLTEKKKFNLEVDIIQKESGKIFNHVNSTFEQDDLQDALASSVQILKNFLDSKSTKY